LDTTDTTNAAGTRFGTSNDRELVSWKSVALLVEHVYELRNQKCSRLYALRKAVRSGGDRTPVLRQHTTSFVKPHVVSLNSRFLLARFFQHGHGMPMRTAATAPLGPLPPRVNTLHRSGTDTSCTGWHVQVPTWGGSEVDNGPIVRPLGETGKEWESQSVAGPHLLSRPSQ